VDTPVSGYGQVAVSYEHGYETSDSMFHKGGEFFDCLRDC
jgi:hypothetical protein